MKSVRSWRMVASPLADAGLGVHHRAGRRALAARRQRHHPELDAARAPERSRARLHAQHDGVPAVQARAAARAEVGLGGGSLAKFIYRRLPRGGDEVLEINPRRGGGRAALLPGCPRGRRAPRRVRVATAAEFVQRERRARRDPGRRLRRRIAGRGAVARASSTCACRAARSTPTACWWSTCGAATAIRRLLQRIEALSRQACCACRRRSRATSSCSRSREPPADLRWDELDAPRARARSALWPRVPALRARAAQMNRYDAERLYLSGPRDVPRGSRLPSHCFRWRQIVKKSCQDRQIHG